MDAKRPAHVLPVIIVAQLLGGSVWFSGNAVVDEVAPLWPQVHGAVSWLTGAVQLGFVAGTLTYAVGGVADRYAAHRVFFGSAVLAALANAAPILWPNSFAWFLGARVLTGFFLAGIYPVGMKLAASWFREGLGWAIGLLVGALVLGTASPHLVRTMALPWVPVTLIASIAALVGGVLIVWWVPEGPNTRRTGPVGFGLRQVLAIFRRVDFSRAALGYFGHMWELYALWAFTPLVVAHVLERPLGAPTVAWWSFAIIGIGAVGCAVGGRLAIRTGSAPVAIVQLCASGLVCACSPWWLEASPPVALAVLLVWGIVVVGDSPQFSALGARTAPPNLVGTALTVMTAVGFALTIGSISLLGAMVEHGPVDRIFLWLVPGPVLGVLAMRPLWRRDPTRPERAS